MSSFDGGAGAGPMPLFSAPKGDRAFVCDMLADVLAQPHESRGNLCRISVDEVLCSRTETEKVRRYAEDVSARERREREQE